jgi:SAM-dependent methyltransferase
MKRRFLRPRVLELGAGSCDHTLRLAQEGFEVTAVEYSQAAVAIANERIAAKGCGHRVRVVCADLFTYVDGLAQGSVDGVYANSVLHFMSSAERCHVYRMTRLALSDNGLIATSFKAAGDALESRGTWIEQTGAGSVVEGTDGIRRIFVSNDEPLKGEIGSAGYQVVDTIRWSVPGYNIAGEDGRFVGFLATR